MDNTERHVETTEVSDFNTIYEYLDFYANTHPNREAIVTAGERISYRELKIRVDACAKGLIAAGVVPGERVAVLEHGGSHFAILLLSCAKTGAIFLALDPSSSLEELMEKVSNSQPVLLFSLIEDAYGYNHTDNLKALADSNPDIRDIILTESKSGAHWKPVADFLEKGETITNARLQGFYDPGIDDPLTIVYTSGTTGKPKGALLSQNNLICAMNCFRRAYAGQTDLLTDLRVYNPIPISTNGAQSDLYCVPLMLGGTVVFDRKYDIDRLFEVMEQEKLSLLYASPMIHAMFFAHSRFNTADFSSIKSFSLAGTSPTQALLEQMCATGAYIWGNYGATEAGTIISVTAPCSDPALLPSALGAMPPEYDYRVVDENNKDLEPGQCGELLLKGPGVFKGYWKDAEKTAEVLTEDGWLSTGDIVRLEANGHMTFMGRRKEVYHISGQPVYPGEIENVLTNHPTIFQAAVIADNHAEQGPVGIAHLAAPEGAQIDLDEIRQYCAEMLEPYKIPAKFFVHRHIPCLPTGKMDKNKLKAWY